MYFHYAKFAVHKHQLKQLFGEDSFKLFVTKQLSNVFKILFELVTMHQYNSATSQ